jgi:hypothetical protein
VQDLHAKLSETGDKLIVQLSDTLALAEQQQAAESQLAEAASYKKTADLEVCVCVFS